MLELASRGIPQHCELDGVEVPAGYTVLYLNG